MLRYHLSQPQFPHFRRYFLRLLEIRRIHILNVERAAVGLNRQQRRFPLDKNCTFSPRFLDQLRKQIRVEITRLAQKQHQRDPRTITSDRFVFAFSSFHEPTAKSLISAQTATPLASYNTAAPPAAKNFHCDLPHRRRGSMRKGCAGRSVIVGRSFNSA